MDGKQKMALAGASLIVTGVGLSVIGMALITPAIVSWSGALLEKGAERALSRLERASKAVGTAAGIAQRTITEAARHASAGRHSS